MSREEQDADSPIMPEFDEAFSAFYANGKRGREEQASLNKGEIPEHLTDLGNARRFERIHGGEVLYSRQLSKWALWTDNGWRWDEVGEISDRAVDIIRSIYGEAAAHPDKRERESLAAHALKSEARGKIEAMLDMAQTLPGIRTDLKRFDRDPYVLGCATSVVELTTGDYRPHWPEAFITMKSPVDFDPEAMCPRWEKFLMEITGDDAELVAFLQRSVGYSLTGSTAEQCFWLLWGNGSNGKTTFVETIMALAGEYGAQIKTEVLLDGRREQRDYHLAELCGKRFVAACESNMGRRMASDLIKQATGGERINARSPYGKPFSFYPQFKIWLSTNHRPRVTDPSAAMWRRIFMVPFNVKYVKPHEVPSGHPGPFVDGKLKEKLCEELPGIMNWVVEGCRAWKAEGLKPPDSVLEATRQYREEENTIKNFIDDSYRLNPEFYVLFGEIYRKYSEWCKENGEQALSSTAFAGALTDMGLRADSKKLEGKTQRIRWGLEEQ